jgi:penicillin-binding protein-related factor A (putative recombinase)
MKSLFSEKQLCHQIIEFLNYQGAYCWRVNSGAIRDQKGYMVKMAKAGTSDILGIYKGRFLALEVKKPETRKNVTEKQTEFLETIKKNGGIAAVVTSPEEALHAITTL